MLEHMGKTECSAQIEEQSQGCVWTKCITSILLICLIRNMTAIADSREDKSYGATNIGAKRCSYPCTNSR